MPELPEVEIARRQLTRWVAGQRIVAVEIPDPSVIRASLRQRTPWPEGVQKIEGLISAVAQPPIRHGKRLGWAFEGSSIALGVHFGMTGAWTRGSRPRHGRLGLVTERDTVWFDDPRKFGAITCVDVQELPERLARGLGPDALDARLSGAALAERLSSRRAIKVALMDQARIAGIGNIQAAETLWRAKIAPTRRADSLSEGAYRRLAAELLAQLEQTIAHDDRDDLVYLSRGGPNPFQIYRREGAPCPRCGDPIHRATQSGRATFWCPTCQPG